MRIPYVCLAGLLGLLAACGSDEPDAEKTAAAPAAKAPAASAATAYAGCMAAANQQASRAESVVAARRCLHLPDAPPPGSTLPPGTPPPPIAGGAEDTTAINSVYTSLSAKDCRVMWVHEVTGASTSRCPGVAGHSLNVHDDDARMSIDVISPDGKAHELNYWGVITHGFSSLGTRAEWRMQGERPLALIVRVNALEDPENPDRTTSYLAVAKITPGETCVTDRIGPVPDANTVARAAADRSAARACLKDAPM